jgi:peptide/nickel transport system substrate-binding protein
VIAGAGPWGTGPYILVEGFSTPEKRTGRVILEANTKYWDRSRMPRLKRIVFDNTIAQKDAVERVKTKEGRVDLVTELSPLETLPVAESRFAKVVKRRDSLSVVVGHFNQRKAGSPWLDVRLRRALNLAVNRADLIRYAAKGNGVVVPALIPANDYGYDPNLAPYPFDPDRARDLLREAGYPSGRPITLTAPTVLETEVTVVSKMLEQVGLSVDRQVVTWDGFNKRIFLSPDGQLTEEQTWDIALVSLVDLITFPVTELYSYQALGGPNDWIGATPGLRGLYDQVFRTVDRDAQRQLIQRMERLTHEQAYFLFLYTPIKLYAVNKAVEFVAYQSGQLILHETFVTDRHWSVRKTGTKR